jgi:HAD superfamily hydrolase (TIGR01509 family)
LDLIENVFAYKSLGIVTTGKRGNTFEILDFHGIRSRFDIIVTGDDVTNPKANPEPYFKAIELAYLLPEQILAFEDSQVGCEAART